METNTTPNQILIVYFEIHEDETVDIVTKDGRNYSSFTLNVSFDTNYFINQWKQNKASFSRSGPCINLEEHGDDFVLAIIEAQPKAGEERPLLEEIDLELMYACDLCRTNIYLTWDIDMLKGL